MYNGNSSEFYEMQDQIFSLPLTQVKLWVKQIQAKSYLLINTKKL